MLSPSETQFLPVAPSDLCFDKNEFIKASFSVDQFLQNHRRKANLEVLRDDLGVYLKVLRSAMIELINKDYADFVNLSSNLIGLDKAISGIQVPLGQLKEEILQVKFNLDEAMNDLSNSLNVRRKLQAQKYSLQRLARVQCSLSKLRNLLYLDSKQCSEETDVADKKVKSFQLDAALMERAASEYNQLQFCIFKCENDVAVTAKEDAKKILDFLSTSLDGMFLRCFLEKDDEGIIRCLRIYVTLDKIADAEALLRKEVVSPALHNIVSESSLQADPRGLQGVYARVIDFIDTNMEQLLKLTTDGRRTQVVKGFDFLVNSLWSELEEHLELHLSSIYAPGNPEMFHQRYCETLEFLSKLEQYCGTQAAVEKLRSHPRFKVFLQRWNLPVYFQIRFQEIAGLLESAINEGNPADTAKGSLSSDFHLRITTVTWSCLLRCWEEGVFLSQLTHRFWKLSLQIVARYYTWIGRVLEEKWPAGGMHSASSSTNETGEISCSIRLQFLVHLHSDVQQLVSKLPYLLDLTVKKLPSLSQQGQSLLKRSLNESEQQLSSRLSLVTHFILGEVSGQSLPHLRQVNDIPRLFRRTNREMPVKPCAYVASLLAAPIMFHRTQKDIVNSELLQQWLILVFSAITQQYHSAVDDVLVSVQKTEESLRRLKKIRDRTSTTASSEAKGIGDDDKIRHQLLLDVYNYCEGIESIGISRASVDHLEELIRLVEAAKDRSEVNK